MTFKTATVLAIALPLGICLFVFILASVFLSIRLFRCHRLGIKLEGQIKDRQDKLDIFAKVLNENGVIEDRSTSVFDLAPLYLRTWWYPTNEISSYADWFSYEEIMPSVLDEVTRLEDALYPTRPPSRPLDIDRDLSIFPNPQQYTTTEIATLLHSPESRYRMIRHLMVSTLLKNTSIKGDPYQTLLPLYMEDIDGLYNLSNAVLNGLHLGRRLFGYMKRFGFYRPVAERTSRFREPFHKYFEALFQPYFKSNSPKDVAGRRASLNEVFDSVTAYGMECLSYFGKIKYNWGEKKDSAITLVPAMMILAENGHYREEVECLRL